jgi:hypothetical protein
MRIRPLNDRTVKAAYPKHPKTLRLIAALQIENAALVEEIRQLRAALLIYREVVRRVRDSSSNSRKEALSCS